MQFMTIPNICIYIPKASKGYLKNVRCIKGGLLRKGGFLANADVGPKKQHFQAFFHRRRRFFTDLFNLGEQKNIKDLHTQVAQHACCTRVIADK